MLSASADVAPHAAPLARLRAITARMLAGYVAFALLGIACGAAIAVGGLNAVYVCICATGCAFIAWDFRIGVVLLILLMPLSGSAVFPHALFGVTGLNPVNLLLVTTLAACMVQGLRERRTTRSIPPRLIWLYVFPLALAGAYGATHVGSIPSVFLETGSIEFDTSGGYLRDVLMKPLLIVIFALLLAQAVSKSKRPERFVIPTVISMWLMGLLVIGFVAASGTGLSELARSRSREFLSALGIHANDLGRLYAVSYALLLFTCTTTTSRALKLLLMASVCMAAIALVLTFSRGAFLAFITVNVAFLIWHRNLRTLIAALLIAALGAVALPDAIYQRAATGIAGGNADEISAGRIERIWLPQLPEIERSPLYGNGLSSILWSQVMREGVGVTYPAVTHPHNAYLQILEDMGIVGTLLVASYFANVFQSLRAASRNATETRVLRGFFAGAAVSLLSLLVAAATDGSFAPRPEQIFLWLAIGMLYGVQAKRAESADVRQAAGPS